jgi:predicted amidohydrolase YtcJ
MNRVCIWCFLILSVFNGSTDQATLIVTGARVWTGNPTQPWAEAIAICGERILAVGGDQEISKLAASCTRVIEARGGMLLPGFTDSHTHLGNPLPAVTPVSLRFARTKEIFIRRIAEQAARAPKGAWILGDWDHRQWGGELPNRHWIDAVTPENPLWLYHVDLEMALANSAALRAAGITRDTKETPRGEIVRDARGEPTGIVKLNAMLLVDAAAEAAARDTNDRNLDEKMLRMAERGITSVHNITGWQNLLTFQRARATGRLRTRIYAAIAPIYAWRRQVEYIAANGSGDDWLRWAAVKGYARNWPELDPNARSSLGLECSLEDFHGWVAASSKAGLQVLVHDGGGTHQLLGIFERVKREQNLSDPRFRIEHDFCLTAADAATHASLGVIGSLQPDLAFSFDDPREFENHLPYRLLLNSGARIAFGSDQPLGSPLAGIALAVLHPIAAGTKMSVEEALRAYTCDPAYASFAEKEKGTIEPGKLADCVLIDRDLTRIPSQQLREARVLMTIVAGKIVYERKP